MYQFALAQLQVPWSNFAKVGEQSIMGVVVHLQGLLLAPSFGTAFRELLEEECFFLCPRLPSGSRCRGTQASWEGMAGAYCLGADTCVELVTKGPGST